jgi:hypothetical protein
MGGLEAHPTIKLNFCGTGILPVSTRYQALPGNADPEALPPISPRKLPAKSSNNLDFAAVQIVARPNNFKRTSFDCFS